VVNERHLDAVTGGDGSLDLARYSLCYFDRERSQSVTPQEKDDALR
jgi:hypothetical protein